MNARCLAVALPLLIVACRSGDPVPPASPAPPTAALASPAVASTATKPGASLAVRPSLAPPSPPESSAGIDVGAPVLVSVGAQRLPVVLVTNSGDRPRSFSLVASWKKGESVASAQGSVFILEPRERRAVNLASSAAIPDGPDSAEAHVERMLPLDPKEADVVSKIQFGRMAIQHGALSTLEVVVTNTDSVPHSLQLGGALLSKDVPIATAAGTVAALGPRLGLPVNLAIAGEDSGHDQILVYVTAVVS